MDTSVFRLLLILALVTLFIDPTYAWGRRRRRRRCATNSCTWNWSACTRTCGGGTQHPVKTGSQGACGVCNMPSGSEPCNENCCPANCRWQSWGNWGICSRNCGGGTQSRSRGQSAQSCGGSACSGPSIETRSCNQRCCPVHCVWASWSSFGPCSQNCGGGVHSRTRGYSIAASCGGNTCPGLSVETRNCNQNCCPANCRWHSWGNWGICSRNCGGGTQRRSRGKSAQICGGSACSGPSIETRACNQGCCTVHCVWASWSSLGPCSQSCGGGVHSRTRGYSTAASCGGNTCPGRSVETRSCNQNCCPVNCVWGTWSNWNDCSKSCGGGKQSKNRRYSVASTCGGTACSGPSKEERACNPQCCPVDCAWVPWGEWGTCSLSCGEGTQSRERRHSIEMSCGGVTCPGNSVEPRSCNDRCCPVDCAWTAWDKWGTCSVSCGSGKQIRARRQDIVEECGGDICVGSPRDVRDCNTQCCPVDCVWNPWSDWNECTKSCGGGTQRRERSISIPLFCGGNKCPGPKVESQDCNKQCCRVDCQWGPWKEWGACTQSCEKGNQTRIRKIAVEPLCGGNQCSEPGMDTRFCNDICCPVHCKWDEWSQWSTCTKSCETGSRHRERVVKVDAVCSGEECTGQTREEKECNPQCCPALTVDCALSPWSLWTGCSHTCGAQGSRNRHRNVTLNTYCGGRACDKNLLEADECNKFCFNGGSLTLTTCDCPKGWKGDCCQEDVDECQFVNCSQNSKCLNSDGSYECVCNHGYTKTGDECLDIDECHLELHDCHAKAECINLKGHYTCTCESGFTGNGTTCSDIDECGQELNSDYTSGDDLEYSTSYYNSEYIASSPLCHNDAVCLNTYGGYNCQCYSGYVGDGVYCADLDECKLLKTVNRDVISQHTEELIPINEEAKYLVPCDIHATCSNFPGRYSCWCEDGYFGDGVTCEEINECDSDPCENGGTCQDEVNMFTCGCPVGYAGSRCELDVDECVQQVHSYGSGVGEDGSGLSINSRNTSVCHNNAICTNTFGSYLCTCLHGFVGDGLSCMDIDECSVGPEIELFSGREESSGSFSGEFESKFPSFQSCSVYSICNNSIGSYFCTCKDGYRGDGFSCKEINECSSNPCKNGGTCMDRLNEYRCLCGNGYKGTSCDIDIHECKDGTHNCDPKNGRCINTEGSHECACTHGYDGDGRTCVDIDECKLGLHNCNAEGELCLNQGGGFLCICQDGYEIKDGECKDINECKHGTHNCDPKNGRCINTDGSHQCACKHGYNGDGRACIDIDECKLGLHNCHAEGKLCLNHDGGFLCICQDGYEMKDGECKDTDECLSGMHDCTELNQQCSNKPGGYDCVCKFPMVLKDGRCEEIINQDRSSQENNPYIPSEHQEKQNETSLVRVLMKPAVIASITLFLLLLAATIILVVKLSRRGTVSTPPSGVSSGVYRKESFGSNDVTEVDTVL